MLYKYIDCQGQGHDGSSFDRGFCSMPGDTSQFLTKSASAVPMTDEMREFWDAYPKKMPDKFLYFRINILGSGEYWGCFPEGNYVITSDGVVKDVSEMAVGDNYISHKNRPNVTKEIFDREHDGDIVTLKVTGIPDISCTPNHPFWVIPREQLVCKKDKYKRCTPDTFHSCPRCGKCDKGSIDLDPQWIEAENLKNGDMLLVPRYRPKHYSDPIHIDYARLIGLYLAEGSITKSDKGVISGLELDFHEEETNLRDDVTGIADRLGISWGVYPQNESHSIRVMLFSRALGEMMNSWCGGYSTNKTIAPAVYTQRDEFIKDVIGGYLDGDGHVSRNGCATIRSCSKKLLLQIKQLLFRLGSNSSWYWEDDPKAQENKAVSPFGQISIRYTDLHILKEHSSKVDACTWEPKTKSDSKSFIWGGFYCIPVRKKTSEHRKCTVYNGTVGYDNSYIINGVSVHNSNRNGDYFPEAALKKYYKTFHHARLYLHHQNKDPKKAHGRVIFATYNDAPYAKRVEVIVAIDRNDPRIQDIIRKIERGERIEVSMGCRVPFDVCFIKQTPIYTASGYQSIEDMLIGDVVITSGNHTRSVESTSVRKYTGDMITISARGLLPITSTANHPYFVLRKENVRNCHGSVNGDKRRHTPDGDSCSTCGKKLDWQICQVSADEVRNGDYLLTPTHANGPDISHDLAYLMGVYAGDGYIVKQRTGKKKDGPYRDMGFGISCGENDLHIEKLSTILPSICKNAPNIYSAGCARKAVSVVTYDQNMAAKLQEYVGRGSHGKGLKSGVFSSQEARLNFIGGCIDSDGCYDPKTGSSRYISTNKLLAYDVWQSCISSGIVASISHYEQKGGFTLGGKCDVYSVYIPSSYSVLMSGYSCKVQPKERSFGTRSFFWKDYLCSPVYRLESEEVENVEVYNLDVEGDDETYVAGGAAVHNCSICGNKASTRKQYCHHLKREMNKLYPDGRRSMAINLDPAFFDVSIVTIPADPSSGGMEKIARAEVSSALLGEIYNMRSKYASSEKEKEAAIEKTGPDDKENGKESAPEDVKKKSTELNDLGEEIGRNDNNMPEHMLDQISGFPLSQIFSTLGAMKIPLRPSEYTCIVISKGVSKPAAKSAYRDGAEFDPAPPIEKKSFDIVSDFNPKLAHIVRPILNKRSMYPHFIGDREDSHIKTARKTKISYPEAASLYAAYVRDVTGLDQRKVAALLSTYPEIRDRLTGALEDGVLNKTASAHDIVRDSYIGQELLKGAYKK